MNPFKSIVVADHRGRLDKFVCEVLGHDRWTLNLSDNLTDLEEILRTKQHHLVILNAELPNLNIQNFMNRLQQTFGPNRPRVIFCLTHKSTRHFKMASKAGVDDFLTVPFSGSEMLMKVEKHLASFIIQDKVAQELEALRSNLSLERETIRKLEERIKSEERFKEEERRRNEAVSKEAEKIETKRSLPHIEEESSGANVIAIKDRRSSGHLTPLPPVPGSQSPKSSPRISPVPTGKEGIAMDTLGRNKVFSGVGIFVALKIHGLEKLVSDLDPEATGDLTGFIFESIRKTVEGHFGRIVQCYDDTVIMIFQKTRHCPDPGKWATRAAIELERCSFFLAEYDALLSQVEFSLAVHSGRISLVKMKNESGSFSFGTPLKELLELSRKGKPSTILITEPVVEEYKKNVSVVDTYAHKFTSSGREILVSELVACHIDVMFLESKPPKAVPKPDKIRTA